jgi:hypothetical protein
MSRSEEKKMVPNSFKTTTKSFPLRRAPLAGRSLPGKIESPATLISKNKPSRIESSESSDDSPVRLRSSKKIVSSPKMEKKSPINRRRFSSSPEVNLPSRRSPSLIDKSPLTKDKRTKSTIRGRSPSSSPEKRKSTIRGRSPSSPERPKSTIRNRSPSSSPDRLKSTTIKVRSSSSSPDRLKSTTNKVRSPSSPNRQKTTIRNRSPSSSPTRRTQLSEEKRDLVIPGLGITADEVENIEINLLTEAEQLEEEAKKLKDQANHVGDEELEFEQEAEHDIEEVKELEKIASPKKDIEMPNPPKKNANIKLLEIASRIQPPTDPKPEYTPRNINGVKYEVVRIEYPKNLAIIKGWLEVIGNLEGVKEKVGDLYAVGSLRVFHIRPNRNSSRPGYNVNLVDNYDEYRETSTSIAAIHPAIWELLQVSDYCGKGAREKMGCSIEKHQIWPTEMASENNDPPCVSNLYCCFKERSFIPVEVSMEQMHLKMMNMVECGFLGRDDYTIHNPTESRDLDADPKLYCIIIFHKRVPEMNRAYIKACLDQTKFRGKIDPNTITEDDPVGKHIPYMCIISWVRVVTMNSIDRKRPPTNNEKYPVINAKTIKDTFQKPSSSRGQSNNRGKRGGY